MQQSDFEHLKKLENLKNLKESIVEGFDDYLVEDDNVNDPDDLKDVVVDEYGEVIDEEEDSIESELKSVSNEDSSIEDESVFIEESNPFLDGEEETLSDNTQSQMSSFTPSNRSTQSQIALGSTRAQPRPALLKSWSKRSRFAVNETDKEYDLFKIYCVHGGGRSLQYISRVTNLSASTLTKISNKNNWKARAADYDRYQLTKRLKESQDSKHQLHMQKLEIYRHEQEVLGRQMTLSAARIAMKANTTLSHMLDSESNLPIEQLPSLLNTAAKLAEVGKSLQSSALGVENLLNVLEEADGE